MENLFNENEISIIYDALFIYRGCIDLDDSEQQEKLELYNKVMTKIEQNYNFYEIKRIQTNL